MADIAGMIEDRRSNGGGKISYDDLAKDIGLNTTTLFKIVKSKDLERNHMSIPSFQKVAEWACNQGDKELLEALAAYAFGDRVKITLG